MKPQYKGERFRTQTNRPAEQIHEVPVTVTGALHDGGYSVARFESFQRVSHRRIEPANDGEPTREQRFEFRQSLLGFIRFEKLLMRTAGRHAPEIRERRVAFRQFVRSGSEQDFSRTRPKHGAHRTRRRRHVSYVEPCTGATGDRVTDDTPLQIVGSMENAQRLT